MSEPSEDPPKIIVDDDWKAQVEQEKRQAAQSEASPPAAEATPPAAAPANADNAASSDEPAARGGDTSDAEASRVATGGAADFPAPPPATFEMLVTMLFTQAMASLGQLPGPDGKMGPVNKPFAKYFIDSVELLGEKTKGNLSDDESKMISEALHAMRMAFVSVKGK